MSDRDLKPGSQACTASASLPEPFFQSNLNLLVKMSNNEGEGNHIKVGKTGPHIQKEKSLVLT